MWQEISLIALDNRADCSPSRYQVNKHNQLVTFRFVAVCCVGHFAMNALMLWTEQNSRASSSICSIPSFRNATNRLDKLVKELDKEVSIHRWGGGMRCVWHDDEVDLLLTLSVTRPLIR